MYKMIKLITFKKNIKHLARPFLTGVAIVLLAVISGRAGAQNPGGVAGSVIWIRADKDAKSADYVLANVPGANRSTNGFNAGSPAANSMLYSADSWSYSSNAAGGYIIMDLGSDQSFKGVATKGRFDSYSWPTDITVEYATDANPAAFVSAGNFTANYNENNSVFNTFTPVTARYVRITVNTAQGYPSMRCDVILSGNGNLVPTADGNEVETLINAVNPTKSFVGTANFSNSGVPNILNFNPTVLFKLGSRFESPIGIFGKLTTNATFYAGKTAPNVFSYGNLLWSGEKDWMPRMNMSTHANWIYMDMTNSGTSRVSYDNTSAKETQNYNIWTAVAGPKHRFFRQMYQNGGVKSQNDDPNANTTNPSFNSNDLSNYPSIIGRNPNGAGLFMGNYAEMISFPTDLMPTDRRKVESYLGIKYGTTLSADDNADGIYGSTVTAVVNEGDYLASDGTKTWSYTGAANGPATPSTFYHNNVAGIGRDDNSALLQKQSSSINSITPLDHMVLMATNVKATMNQTNSGTIASDLSFNVWGDNNASATTTTSSNLPASAAGPACALRLPRQWRLQRTGTGISNVQVQIDLTGTGFANLSTLTAADFDLLIDRDGNGNFTDGTIDALTPASYSNTAPFLLTFDRVNWDTDLSGTDIFTIVVNKTNFAPPPVLISAGNSVTAPLATCITSIGAMQFVDNIASPAQKYMQINPNGNSGYNFGSGITAMNNLPLVNNQTISSDNNGTAYATTLANRMYQASTTGAFTVNGGMVVRIYYQQSDLDNANNAALIAAKSIDAASVDKAGKWFKYEGSFTDILANQLGTRDGFSAVYASKFFDAPVYGIENGVNYVEFSGIQSFSSFGYMAAAGSPATFSLPVKLISIIATSSNCKGLLEWATSAEHNSSRYEVEKSTDGLVYNRVGTVASKNSSTGNAYRFTCNGLAPGKNIFRLKMIDINGSFEYSKNVVINNNCSTGVAIIMVSPNPTTSVVNVSGLSGINRIQVINAQGQKMTNVVTRNSVKEIDLTDYAKGIYIVRVIAADGIMTNISIVKQ